MDSLRSRFVAVALVGSMLFGAVVVVAVPSAVAHDGEREHPTVEDRLERMRERLDDAVENGRITEERAGEIRDRLEQRAAAVEARRGERQAAVREIADAVGLTTDELIDARRSGLSLAEIASDAGVDPEVVVDVMVAQAQSRLDAGVESGRISEERAAEISDGLRDEIVARVNGERAERGDHRGGPWRDRPLRPGHGPGHGD